MISPFDECRVLDMRKQPYPWFFALNIGIREMLFYFYFIFSLGKRQCRMLAVKEEICVQRNLFEGSLVGIHLLLKVLASYS